MSNDVKQYSTLEYGNVSYLDGFPPSESLPSKSVIDEKQAIAFVKQLCADKYELERANVKLQAENLDLKDKLRKLRLTLENSGVGYKA